MVGTVFQDGGLIDGLVHRRHHLVEQQFHFGAGRKRQRLERLAGQSQDGGLFFDPVVERRAPDAQQHGSRAARAVEIFNGLFHRTVLAEFDFQIQVSGRIVVEVAVQFGAAQRRPHSILPHHFFDREKQNPQRVVRHHSIVRHLGLLG